jgi:fucose permease
MTMVDFLASTRKAFDDMKMAFGLPSARRKMSRPEALYIGLFWSLLGLIIVVAGWKAFRAEYVALGLFSIGSGLWILAGTVTGLVNFFGASRGRT